MELPEKPKITLPSEVEAHLRAAYAAAAVILEYGSGGSTVIGAEQPGKLIFSVESDKTWAVDLQRYLDVANLPSPAILYHVDIGEVKDWGRPTDDRQWRYFHRYPLRIWDEPFFRAPDLILIDGRFRAACLVAALLRTQKPVKVLFDDYVGRDHYHTVEEFVSPVLTIGRMAEFHLEPGMLSQEKMTLAVGLFGQTTYASELPKDTHVIR